MTADLVDQPNVPWCTAAQVIAIPWFADLGNDPTFLPVVDQLCQVASNWLWRATGRQFSGRGSTTVRPVPKFRNLPRAQMMVGPGVYPSEYFDSRGGRFGWPLPFGRGEYAFEVLLGYTPVVSVDQVVLEGVIFPQVNGLSGLLQWRLDDARWLVRTDGEVWPYWQDWTHDSSPGGSGDQTSTWQVSLTWGENPPPDGVYAAEVLAGELALAATGADACRLPNRVQSVARQGVSMLLVDPQILLMSEKWGLPEIDMFVQAVNPAHLTQPASITSPDLPRAIRRAGTMPGS